jgi:hypothetical protein
MTDFQARSAGAGYCGSAWRRRINGLPNLLLHSTDLLLPAARPDDSYGRTSRLEAAPLGWLPWPDRRRLTDSQTCRLLLLRSAGPLGYEIILRYRVLFYTFGIEGLHSEKLRYRSLNFDIEAAQYRRNIDVEVIPTSKIYRYRPSISACQYRSI